MLLAPPSLETGTYSLKPNQLGPFSEASPAHVERVLSDQALPRVADPAFARALPASLFIFMFPVQLVWHKRSRRGSLVGGFLLKI